MYKEILGYSGSFLLSICLIPQVYKSYNTRDVDSLSPFFIGIGIFANFLMISYGILIKALPVLIANSSVLLNNILLLTMYYRFTTTNPNDILPTMQQHKR